MRIATGLLALGLALAAAAPVHAQESRRETEARRVFEAGEAAFNDARYGDALVHFNRAYDQSHRPALLFNIGLCHDRLRDDAEAIEAYERYLTLVPSASNRREVDGRLEALHRAERRRVERGRVVRPAHVARAAANDPAPPTRATATADVTATATVTHSPAVYETWWFWTVVGVVVVGGAVGIGVAASGDEPLPVSDLGGTIFTLGSGR